MPESIRLMLKTNPWREPFTVRGIRPPALGPAGRTLPFQIHEVGAFTMDDRWHYRAVQSPFSRLYLCLDPGASVSVGGRRCPLSPGVALHLPPGLRFDCHGKVGVRHLWFHFTEVHGRLDAGLLPQSIPLVRATVPLVESLFREIRQQVLPGFHHRCLGLLHLIRSQADETFTGETSPRLANVLALMTDRFSDPPSVPLLAASVHLSPGAFGRWFRKSTGLSPARFLKEHRLREAARLLRYTDMGVDDIAAATGWADRNHLSHAFSKRYGQGPAGFRTGWDTEAV